MKGFIIYPTYETVDQQTVVQLFGRLENGQSFVTVHHFRPYFFIRKSDEKEIPEHLPNYTIEKTNFTNFAGEPVIKISAANTADSNELAEKLGKSMETYEADIKPHMRFLIENNLFGTIEIDNKAEYESSEKVDRVYHNPTLKSSEFSPKLKIVSIDTEWSSDGDRLFCIGLVAQNYKKNFMVTKHKIPNTISCSSETECLEKFKSEMIKLDPDIITGWNVIGFDLKSLQDLGKKLKVKLDIGRNNDPLRLRIESHFFRTSTADVSGRQVIDALYLIKDPFIKEAPTIKHAEFESYTLEDVSQTLLGKGKLIAGNGRHNEIDSLYKQNTEESHKKLADYNLTDCSLVLEIVEKTKTIELAVERLQLTGLPLDKITASIAAFDSLYMREARKRNLVCPTLIYKQKEAPVKGGYVYSSKPGIYKNVLVFDFKSLYPSIIRTFNIDPASFLEHREKNVVESPNGAYFKNTYGVLPAILDRLHAEREKAKKEKRELSNFAIKIIMNAFVGTMASQNSRYFHPKLANATTNFAQFIIKLTAKEIEKKGYPVLYSDTDSVFAETRLPAKDADELGHKIAKEINEFYQNYIKKNYNRESKLELQFEKQYIMMMIPALRIKEEEQIAAKKRYAGLKFKDGKEKLEVVGLEAIRGDWTDAAKEFQIELLTRLFHGEKVESFIRDYIKKIRSGVMDQKLIYKKSIRKDLEEYTKTTPPHVKAARLLDRLDSNMIEYVCTVEGPEPIQKVRHKIDYDHYIEKQIKPIANQILPLFNVKFEDLSKKSKQTTLFPT